MRSENKQITSWNLVSLGEITVDLIGGGTPSTSQPEYWDGDIPWMTSANLSNRVVNSGMRNITEKGLRNSATNVVPKGSLLISTRVGIGKVSIAGIDVAISQDLTGLVPDKTKVNVEYLYWAILSKSFHLASLSQGSTVKGLTRDYVRSLKMNLPPLPEQKKIAEILSTVDQANGKVDEAIEKTQRLKKGLMQELLTKGIGHKEFKDTEIGRIPRQWDVVQLEKILISYKNGIYKPDEFYGSGYPSIRMYNIENGRINTIGAPLLRVTDQELQDYGLEAGDILVNRVNTPGLVGKSGVVPYGLGKITFESKNIRVRLDKTKVFPDFFGCYVQTASYLNQMGSRAKTAVAQATITQDDLNSVILPLPPLVEQQKIAEILSAVDKRLGSLRNRKEKLVRIKKGLMNDLLTGKKRVRLDT
jgi:type I restriction enzyme S subunit